MAEYDKDKKYMDARVFARELRTHIRQSFGISTRRPNPVNSAYAEKLGIELEQVVSALAGEEPCSEILNDMRARQIIIKHRVYEWRADKEARPAPSKLPPAL